MRFFWFAFVAMAIVSSCSNSGSEQVKEDIKKLEDELSNMDQTNLDAVEVMRDSLSNTLMRYYRQNPTDDYAPEALDKVHFIYSAKGDYVNAAKYADTILDKYPDYVNRMMVIESQYNNYDMFIKPRDKEKVRYYLELLLKEDKSMTAEQRGEFEYRLEFIDLTVEQLMERNMTELK
jgi:outer membrane protein assembly factor BamD (BamD/ComL family)